MEDFYKKAKLSAVRLLGFRAQSVAEMREKLLRQGFAEGVVRRVVSELRDQGYLNDQRFALEFVRSQLLHKPCGRFMLTAKLKDHGLGDDLINNALDKELSAEKEKELARQLAINKKKEFRIQLSKLSPLQKGKLGRYLASRGFAADLVWEVIEELKQ
jgi:regulatory protein